MLDYLLKAVFAYCMGIVPYFEIYVAVPASIGTGLDPVSAVIWAGFGNFTAVPLIVLFHKQLCKIPKVGDWLINLPEGRHKKSIDKYGNFFILFTTPLMGIWVVAAAAKAVGFQELRLYITSALSILIYGTLTAVLTMLGIDWLTG